MEKVKLNWIEIIEDINALVKALPESGYTNIYCVPKNGMILGHLLASALKKHSKLLGAGFALDEGAIGDDTLIFDDLIDSGRTLSRWPNNDHAVLYRKPNSPQTKYCVREIAQWIEFPFEEERPASDAVVRILQACGEDPNREGLLKTPERFMKMMGEMTNGYNQTAEKLFESVFQSSNDQMVIVKDIDFFSLCEHHMVPFFGKAHIAYLPSGKVLGLSKFARLVEMYARRLQIQENLTQQIGDAITEYLHPLGCMVVIKAKHLCMAMRGVQKANAKTVTSYISGAFKTNSEAREEALKLLSL